MQPKQHAKSAAILAALGLVSMAVAFAQPPGNVNERNSRNDGLEDTYHQCGGDGGQRPAPPDSSGTGDGLDGIYERCGGHRHHPHPPLLPVPEPEPTTEPTTAPTTSPAPTATPEPTTAPTEEPAPTPEPTEDPTPTPTEDPS